MGMQLGPVKTFQDRTDDVATAAAFSADALDGQSEDIWFLSVPTPVVDPFDEETMHKLFDRSELDKMAKRVYEEDDAMLVEMVSAEMQSAYIGAMERDFRMRYRPRLRILAHERARRMFHGEDGGLMDLVIQREVKNLKDQGKEVK